MSKVTLQSIFNKVVKGLASQKFEQCATEGGNCLYYKGGMRCAIGYLMTEKKAKAAPRSNYTGIAGDGYLPKTITKVLNKDIDYHICIGNELQCCHDVGDIQSNLIAFATKYKLKLPKELE